MPATRTGHIALACILLSAGTALAGETGAWDRPAQSETGEDVATENLVLNANLLAFGVIAAWGAANWDYGDNTWHTTREGWFGADTKEGGADKGGHFYTSYLTGRGLTGYFRHRGMNPEAAAFAGAASSLAAMSFMEIGDGFSPYGFAPEDQAMNLAGATAAWLLARHPGLDRRLAFRGEYRLHVDHLDDFVTDYERWRYFLVLKLDGFESLPPALRWLELHAGYAARGYSDASPANDRRLGYLGAGISLTRLARAAGWQRTAVFFDYAQWPGTVAASESTR